MKTLTRFGEWIRELDLFLLDVPVPEFESVDGEAYYNIQGKLVLAMDDYNLFSGSLPLYLDPLNPVWDFPMEKIVAGRVTIDAEWIGGLLMVNTVLEVCGRPCRLCANPVRLRKHIVLAFNLFVETIATWEGAYNTRIQNQLLEQSPWKFREQAAIQRILFHLAIAKPPKARVPFGEKYRNRVRQLRLWHEANVSS